MIAVEFQDKVIQLYYRDNLDVPFYIHHHGVNRNTQQGRLAVKSERLHHQPQYTVCTLSEWVGTVR